jgi:rod shape-determining protein MreD
MQASVSKDDPNYLLFIISVFLAFCFSILPLKGIAANLRPEMICLVMFYWTLKYPQHYGILLSWLIGLCWDVLLGTTLGVHGLALALQTYLVLSMIQRLQMYPLLQQSFVVFIVVGIVLMLYRWIDGFLAQPARDMAYMLGAVGSAVCWPLLTTLLQKIDRV